MDSGNLLKRGKTGKDRQASRKSCTLLNLRPNTKIQWLKDTLWQRIKIISTWRSWDLCLHPPTADFGPSFSSCKATPGKHSRAGVSKLTWVLFKTLICDFERFLLTSSGAWWPAKEEILWHYGILFLQKSVYRDLRFHLTFSNHKGTRPLDIISSRVQNQKYLKKPSNVTRCN